MMIYDGNDDDNDEGAGEDEEENVIMKIMFVLYWTWCKMTHAPPILE